MVSILYVSFNSVSIIINLCYQHEESITIEFISFNEVSLWLSSFQESIQELSIGLESHKYGCVCVYVEKIGDTPHRRNTNLLI